MVGHINIIQANLNKSWRALDLLRQYVLEQDIGLALISEPPRGLVPNNNCFLSRDGLAAIVWRSEGTRGGTCRMVSSGKCFVVANMKEIYLIACYISPNVDVTAFSNFLLDISRAVNGINNSMLIVGDFNARSVLWGSSTTDRRGELIERWAAALNISLMNESGVYTCVRPQGSSIIDLSWASPGVLERGTKWSVSDSAETF